MTFDRFATTSSKIDTHTSDAEILKSHLAARLTLQNDFWTKIQEFPPIFDEFQTSDAKFLKSRLAARLTLLNLCKPDFWELQPIFDEF